MVDKKKTQLINKGKKVTKHITTTDKISKKMWDNSILKELNQQWTDKLENLNDYDRAVIDIDQYAKELNPIEIVMKNNFKGKPVSSFVTVTSEKMDIFNGVRLTAYDRAVHDAVLSLTLADNEYFSDEMILSTMRGISSHKKGIAYEQQLQNIRDSMYKMQSVKIHIDAEQERAMYEFSFKTRYKFIGNIVPCEIVEGNVGGKKKVIYHILSTLPLYEYSHEKNQIAQIDLDVLNIPKLTMNKENTALITALYHAVLARKNSKSKLYKQVINLEKIYKDANIDFENAPSNAARWKRKNDMNKRVLAILDYWKSEKTAYFIHDYSEIFSSSNKTKLEGISIKIR